MWCIGATVACEKTIKFSSPLERFIIITHILLYKEVYIMHFSFFFFRTYSFCSNIAAVRNQEK